MGGFPSRKKQAKSRRIVRNGGMGHGFKEEGER
jgi:hypothetical protein